LDVEGLGVRLLLHRMLLHRELVLELAVVLCRKEGRRAVKRRTRAVEGRQDQRLLGLVHSAE
jgi:hypothetical protein